MAKGKHKGLKITGIVLGALLLALGIFLIVWFCGASYPEYEKISRSETKIPGLDEGISPQGVCPLPENKEGYTLAMSGYMVKGGASRVYLFGEETNKYITLEKEGKALTTHFGGITCSGNYLLVASGKQMVRIPLSAALNAENGDSVAITDDFSTDINNAYCYYYGGKLYVGEFYRESNYKTQESHHITKDGETNYAFIYEYDADESAAGGVVSTTPAKAISVRGLVQGVAVCEDGIVLSTSYGLADSHIYVYENILGGETEDRASVGDAEVPLYHLDGTNLKKDLTAPCMSEEICIADGRLYILYESACNKYKYFVRVRTYYIDVISLEGLL